MLPGRKEEPPKTLFPKRASRREFLATTAVATASVAWLDPVCAAEGVSDNSGLSALPKGPTPAPVSLPHFPDRMHAFVWRNWELVPIRTLARVLGTSVANVAALAAGMGLPKQPRISRDQQRRSYISVIKRNWHLLPYEQLLELLGWTAEQLAYTLREDDFLFAKLGGLKPKCEPLRYAPPDAEARKREEEIAKIARGLAELDEKREPRFAFVEQVSKRPK